MLYEEWHGLQIPKIGFGTWSIGGGSFANRSKDAAGLAALRSALDLGYIHFDTAEMYANGHTEELLGQAIRESGVPRESLIITTKVSPQHLSYSGVLKACERSVRHLAMDYIDLYLIHWPIAGMKLPDAFRALNELVGNGKVRHLGVSNFGVRLLQQSEKLAETPLLTDQVPYSIADRKYAKNGVLAYCQERGILLTAYTPLAKGNLKVEKALRSVADAHSATPQQIALAWLVAQPRVITIPMSADIVHQQQNIEAACIRLAPEEKAQLA
jgi:diketogulonate reductase-like aldo/keto reductase